MLQSLPMLILGLAGLVFVLWRMAGRMQARMAKRRQGQMMQHLDWTRQPDPRRDAPRKGLLGQLLR